MHSPLPVSRWEAFLCLFPLAFLLADPAAHSAMPAPPSQQVAALGSNQAAKLLIHIEKPDYPPIAKVNFIQGPVRLEIRVSAEGRVAETHVVEGEPILAAAAMHAVQQWLYHPCLSPQGAIPFVTDVVVRFTLHPHSFWERFPADPEGYLQKQVHPPEVIAHPQSSPSASRVQVKVLVGSDGKVLDATALGAKEPEIWLARKNLEMWKFQPAHWGTLAVPWYITVQVPLDPAPLDEDASTAKH